MLLMVPFLFIAGVVFAYYVVMPPALKFLLNFNTDQFNVQIRGSEYYGFFVTTLLGRRDPLSDPRRHPRDDPPRDRHAAAAGARTAATRSWSSRSSRCCCPGTDPITMLISMAPLYLLFELSLLLARWFGTRPATTATKVATTSLRFRRR